MELLLTSVPAIPLASAALLLLYGRNLPQQIATLLGVGSIGLSAVAVFLLALQ